MRELQTTQLTYDDPLLASCEFPFTFTLFPLGFPLTIETNSELVLEAARASWSVFPQAYDVEPVHLSIGVTPTTEDRLPAPPVFRSRGHLLSVISDAANFITSDFARGFQFGWVNEQVARDAAFFRYYFLDVTVLTTIQQRYLAPIHGACVAHHGRGVTLCGPSSAGKSTLAYACSRVGWTYVSDDATFLVRTDDARQAIGNCHSIRFRESTRNLFPEISPLRPSLRPNGTSRLELSTRHLPITTAPACSLDHVVFLNRDRTGPATLHRTSKERALDWFASFVSYGESKVRQAQLDSYRRLLISEPWELQYTRLEDAITLLSRFAG